MLKRLGRTLRAPLRWLWGLRRWLARLLLLWLLLTLLLVGAIVAYGHVDRAQTADVIVVLGAGLNHRDQPGPALTRRADHAAQLYADGIAPAVICTGGVGSGRSRSEADACAELLRARGVPAAAIALEEESRSTEENALYTRAIMDTRGWKTAVVVSDGYHLLRAALIFSREGIAHTTSAAASGPPLTGLLTALGREVAAFHWLLVKTVLNLPITYISLL